MNQSTAEKKWFAARMSAVRRWHTIGYLPDAADDRLASTRASLAGVEARPLSAYGIGTVRAGLVLGFGTVSSREIERGARALAQAIGPDRR